MKLTSQPSAILFYMVVPHFFSLGLLLGLSITGCVDGRGGVGREFGRAAVGGRLQRNAACRLLLNDIHMSYYVEEPGSFAPNYWGYGA